MNHNKPVPLERRFSPVPRSEHDSDERQILEVLGNHGFKRWPEMDQRYRSVILAEAGAGKTFEMIARAEFIEAQGSPAFCIRIEDILGDFEKAFEVGSAETFQQWLSSQDEAWIFLDSVDEARLSNPKDFEKAIRQFATAIQTAQLRAHICVSSRPYAWRPKSDRELIECYLPYKKPQTETTDQNSEPTESSEPSETELEIYWLDPLDEADIRLFAFHRSAPEVDRLIAELKRLNVMAMAERPFDLEGILHKWTTDRELGGRSELLQHNIELRLKESDPDKADQRPLNLGMAHEGARMLAAAVILCGKPGIQVPDNTHERVGIEAEKVLSNWEPSDVRTLLERAIFNDVIYGTVRFRHREVREFLAAEWFAELLQRGNAYHAIEALIFREQYGEHIVTPRLRPILPWLILKDENIRKRALDIHPDIAVEGGDPACLPLPVRKIILADILARIVRMDKVGAAQDNNAIARIAQPDLTDETLSLIKKYIAHDDAVFFLGRVVWQGKMLECVPPLFAVAHDPMRDIYSRIVATRTVMSCGTAEQRSTLWDNLLKAQAEIPRELLPDLLQGTSTDGEGVALLLKAIDKLPPYNRFKVTGLRQALHGYIDRLPILNADCVQPLAKLFGGLQKFLARPPHMDLDTGRLSEEFAWLLAPVTHAVERLVSARAASAVQDVVLETLIIIPDIREMRGEYFDDYKDKLQELVPAWPELNDTLFWWTVKVKRACLERDGERLNSDLQVTWPAHYWFFGPDSFFHVLEWLNTRELEDDRLVALSLALRIYAEAKRPTEWLGRLRATVADDAVLIARLEGWLNPKISEQESERQQQSIEFKKKHERQRREQERVRSDWVDRLKKNPDLIRNPPGLKPGGFSLSQYWLMMELEGNDLRTKLAQKADWEFLIDEFGNDVANAYRDAAMSHWRHYHPGLRSEGADPSSTPGSLYFAMAGLEIESREHSGFPTHLNESEVDHSLRYITWELNGFPSWLETMYQANRQAVIKALRTEIFWELDNTNPNQLSHRLLHDLTYYAPWLHHALIEPLQTWLRENDLPTVDSLRYSLHILKSGGMDPAELGTLAQTKTDSAQSNELLSHWFAIWVDAQPDSGIPALSEWLTKLDTDQSSIAGQLFITALMGNQHHASTGPTIGNFQTAEHLKSLYVLMHTYIRVEDDIHHGTGAYSPKLRDHAQDARGRIFNLLSEIPGKTTYVALKELIEKQPNLDHRLWMAERAYRRAEEDGDLEPWSTTQVSEFGTQFTRTPVTHRQLFDLTVARLIDLKNWLERGDTSPYVTWQRVEKETEMRNLVADRLNQNADHSFTVSQEPEVSNNQRMDIWLQNQNAEYPIPIELKLLDKNWSGPKLCERLRNQLAGDYLCDGTERCGAMLLIWQGRKSAKQWKIGGKLVGVSDLQDALKKDWCSISNCYPNVADIEVIVIDLTQRAIKSDS